MAEAARAEFAEHGYAGARTDRIVRAAGVSKQLLFYYYGSKAGLYQAVVEEAQASLSTPTSVERVRSSGRERLRQELHRLFDSLAVDPDVAKLVLQAETPAAGPASAAATIAKGMIDQLQAVITEGQGTGHFRDDVDPATVARQSVVLILGYLAIEHALQPDGRSEASRSAWLHDATGLLIRSLTW